MSKAIPASESAQALYEELSAVCRGRRAHDVSDAVLTILANVVVGETLRAGGDQAMMLDAVDAIAADLRESLLGEAGKFGIKPAVLSS